MPGVLVDNLRAAGIRPAFMGAAGSDGDTAFQAHDLIRGGHLAGLAARSAAAITLRPVNMKTLLTVRCMRPISSL